jgi:hypothetical protein
LTLTVQVAPAKMVPFEKLTEPLPALGAKVGAPHPEVVALGTGATTIAPGRVGKVSENATPVRTVAVLGLLIVNVKVLSVFTATELGEKLLAMVGGKIWMTRFAVAAVAFVPPLVVVSPPLAIVLIYVPTLVPVTFTVTLQLEFPEISPLLSLMPKSPAAKVPPLWSCKVPPQVFVVVKGVATTRPGAGVVGKVSVNVAPLRVASFELLSVIVSVEIPLGPIGLGEKLLTIVGRARIVKLAVAGAAFVPLLEVITPTGMVFV